MKLKLNKQNVTTLSSKDMENINGGGQGWSNFRTGNCRYSDNNAEFLCETDTYGNSIQGHRIGCAAASLRVQSISVLSKEASL